MTRKKNEPTDTETCGAVAAQDNDNTFPVTLRAKTCEELSEMLNDLAAPEGQSLYTGCVARDYTDGTFILIVDTKPKEA